MRQWIVLFVLMDAIILIVAVWWIRNRRDRMTRLPTGPSLDRVTRFARDAEPRIREYMDAHYRGDRGELSRVLPGLATRLEHEAGLAGLDLGREAFEAIIARALAAQGIARERDVHRAFEDARSLESRKPAGPAD